MENLYLKLSLTEEETNCEIKKTILLYLTNENWKTQGMVCLDLNM